MKAFKFKSSVLILFVLGLMLGINTVLSQQAVGPRDAVVGDGTPGSCTQGILDNAIDVGGIVTFNCAPGENTIAITGSIVINTGVTVTIDGTNNGEEIILSNVGVAGSNSRVLDIITAAANITLQNLTIQNGNLTGGANGGGVRVNITGAVLNTTNVNFKNNAIQTGAGGAVFVAGGVTFNANQSSFINNTTTGGSGGAMGTAATAIVNVANSTFSGNNAGVSGGVLRTVTTASGNFTNNTFVGNTSPLGSVFSRGGAGAITLTNSILSGADAFCDGATTEGGGNVLFGGGACAGIAAASTGDPLLGALTTDSDGPTQYYPIGAGSSAFNLVPCGALTVDQIGTARPQGAACDAGAIELITAVPTETPTNTEVPPTETPTNTEVVPVTETPTETDVPPTETEVPPTETATEETPVETATATATEGTPVEGTATATATEGTPVEGTATATATEGTPVESTATATATETEIPAVNLIVNSGFEVDDDDDNQPDGWSPKNLTKDKRKCNDEKKDYAFAGECAYLFKGFPGEKTKILQKPAVSGFTTGDTLTLSLYVNTKLAAAGKIATVTVKYTDTSAGENGDGQDKFNIVLSAATADGTYENKTDSLVVASAPSKLTVQLRSKNTSGKIFFDEISLTVTSGGAIIGLP